MIPVWNNTISNKDLESFNSAVENRRIMEGNILQELEERLCESTEFNYVVGTSSGTAALTLAYMAIGIVPGDQIIVPDLTFIATANAAHILGAEVISAPVKKSIPTIDTDQIDSLISPRVKAIATVDLNGRISDIEGLAKKCSHKGIYIIDDACQAFLSKKNGKCAGLGADIACFSMAITKTISSIQGGFVATNNKELYDKMKIIKTQGMSSVFEGNEYVAPGYNFKLPDAFASIALSQLGRIDEKIHHMKKIDRMYLEGLSGLRGINMLERKPEELLWMTDILCEDRDSVRSILSENDIQSRPIGAPMHNAHFIKGQPDNKNADCFHDKILYLPSGPDQPIENIEKVIDVLRKNL